MPIDFGSLKKINEGKTKVIYSNPEDEKTVFMVFKDDITAGDGAKHDVIAGKALVDWGTNRDIFEFLNRMGVRTHYVESPQEKVSLVKKLDFKINLEVVTRRVAAGSILEWGNVEEGARYCDVGSYWKTSASICVICGSAVFLGLLFPPLVVATLA